jgi:hypothetical protein
VALRELPLHVIRRSDYRGPLATHSTLDPVAAIEGGDTMIITEIGYLLLTLSAVAVLLFCWLGLASLTNLNRDK